jgi:TolB-like protein
MPNPPYAFGAFVFDVDRGVLLQQGVPVAMGSRGLALLRALLEARGNVLTKSELMDAAWPGASVEESNLTVQIAQLRRRLGSSADSEAWIATVPRVGYRFIRAPDERTAGFAGRLEAAEGDAEPSIAVLPFVNLSDDPEQEYFADGLTEDIIGGLSRIRGLLVSARNSSFVYKNKAVDVKQIGRELRVRYVLEGSVRRLGQRVRISANLADSITGLQVWSERFDSEISDFFSLQDQIRERVVGAIEPQLYAAERQRYQRKQTNSLDAWGFVMRAMPYVWTWLSRDDIETAVGLLRRATDIDPNYPRANSLLALGQAALTQLGSGDPSAALAAALASAQRAIEHDPADPWGHVATGYVHMVSRQLDFALGEFNEAIEQNPSLALAHVFRSSAYCYGGMPEEGLAHLTNAIRLSPHDYSEAGVLATAALCHLLARRFKEARDNARRAVRLRPAFATAWRTLAAAAGLVGDSAEAAQALLQAMRFQPSLSIDWLEKYHPIVHAKDRAIFIEGLRAAGLT